MDRIALLYSLAIQADHINAFTDPEVLWNDPLKENARRKEEQERAVKTAVVMAKKIMNKPV